MFRHAGGIRTDGCINPERRERERDRPILPETSVSILMAGGSLENFNFNFNIFLFDCCCITSDFIVRVIDTGLVHFGSGGWREGGGRVGEAVDVNQGLGGGGGRGLGLFFGGRGGGGFDTP